MDKHQQLREIVARLCRVEPGDISPDYSLAPLVTRSISVHLLDSALRRHLEVDPPPLRALNTYADLESAVLGSANHVRATAGSTSEPGAPLPPERNLSAFGVACGLDLEKVASLPLADDYWTHEFYVNTFSKTEIAYCVLQVNPLEHFAARWCAKEALRKCDPAYLQTRMADVQVYHDESGAPRLQSVLTQEILPHALSLSHVDDTAAAVVLRFSAPLPPPPSPQKSETQGAGRSAAGPDRHRNWIAATFLLSLFGAVIALIGFCRTLGW